MKLQSEIKIKITLTILSVLIGLFAAAFAYGIQNFAIMDQAMLYLYGFAIFFFIQIVLTLDWMFSSKSVPQVHTTVSSFKYLPTSEIQYPKDLPIAQTLATMVTPNTYLMPKTPKIALSIIIPTLNEAGNLSSLLRRIDTALTESEITYEVIVVDDHSTDTTQSVIKELVGKYPIQLFTKEGKQGKAFSLIEGFTHANADVIAIIDGDLQYPPEALPVMFKGIQEGIDIAVANRVTHETPIIRRITSKLFMWLFIKLLHGIDYDVQSGMKMFRKEVIRRFPLNPSPWTFDLEFMLKAYHAGYSIASIPVDFKKRQTGKTKVNIFKVARELALSALKLRFVDFGAFPFLPEHEEIKGKGFHYKNIEYVHHTDLEHNKSAITQVNTKQKVFIFTFLFLLLISFVINWHGTLVVFIALLTFLYFADLLFNFFLISRSFTKSPEIRVSQEEIDVVPDSAWPTYTIFCPLYKEWNVVPQFVSAIDKIDYPKDKMQVMLLLEEDDTETIENVKKYDLPSHFVINVVPHSKPKTKPKALNYGMLSASGEYIVVYDAEDVPDPLQMKKAILAFKKANKRTVCIQAKLNFYNPHQNILTRVFTAEYSLWFDLVLTGLQSIHAPIPLGGTSNHFKKETLVKLKGWDSFNVTEDCDLGMRLVKHGYQTAVIDSVTFEEANSDLKNWFSQRTRWIKGYIQSYFVHMRNPSEFFIHWKEPHAITFQLIVGGKILSMFINPVMWFITISYFVFRPIVGPFIESFYPAPVLYMGIFSLLIGNFLYMYYYMIGCYKREQDEIIKYVFLVPFYWLAMSIAATRAVYQVIFNPHYWAKTKHGLHLNNSKAMNQAKKYTGEGNTLKKANPQLAV